MTEQTPSIAKESTAAEELHPGPNDVLLGRGASIIMHEGNVKFRAVVKNHKERYKRTRKRMEKEQIAKEIMDVIASRNGRFLQRIPISSSSHTTPQQRDCWRIASHITVIEKIKQALRDHRPSYQNRPEKNPRSDVRKRKKSQLPNPQRHGSESEAKPSQGSPFFDSQYLPRRDMYSRSEMEVLSRRQLPNSYQEMQVRRETLRSGPPEMQYVPLDELLARNRMAMLLRGGQSTPLWHRPLFDDLQLRRLRHQLREQELSVDLLQNQQGEEAAIPPRYESSFAMPRLDPGDPVAHVDPRSGADPRLAQQSTRDLVAMLQDQDHRITMQLDRLARLRQYEDEDARRYEDDRLIQTGMGGSLLFRPRSLSTDQPSSTKRSCRKIADCGPT